MTIDVTRLYGWAPHPPDLLLVILCHRTWGSSTYDSGVSPRPQ